MLKIKSGITKAAFLNDFFALSALNVMTQLPSFKTKACSAPFFRICSAFQDIIFTTLFFEFKTLNYFLRIFLQTSWLTLLAWSRLEAWASSDFFLFTNCVTFNIKYDSHHFNFIFFLVNSKVLKKQKLHIQVRHWSGYLSNMISRFLNQNSWFHPDAMKVLLYPGLHLNRKYNSSLYEICSMLVYTLLWVFS